MLRTGRYFLMLAAAGLSLAACRRPGQPLAALPPHGCRVPLAGKTLRGFFDKLSRTLGCGSVFEE